MIVRLNKTAALADRDAGAFAIAEVLAQDDRTHDAGGAREHDRRDGNRPKRTPARARDEGRRHARIDRDATAAPQHYRAIHQEASIVVGEALLPRQKDVIGPRREKIARAHEHVGVRGFVVLVDRLVGRQRRPADEIVALPPVDPGRAPFLARNPDPAEPAIERPAAIVIGDPAEILFRIPIPAPLVGIGPVPHAVGLPVGRHLVRNPHFAPARVLNPLAVSVERRAKIDRVLRVCRLRQKTGTGGRREDERDREQGADEPSRAELADGTRGGHRIPLHGGCR